ncbi:hypothetical protein BB559_001048 [Furculomyces boomerangus]|uniref:Uncharacterized protein n=2 Tax=Harpellales TaxID=61421 RepID=A0A2T9Z373_9FUNG|nr:hypothetical protein BB559_001048 [Furculomyces boomerangus]PVZ98294.1 hypothetical protein BB558_005691 [Smittium angustum]PWA02444.1 hypothetical protein BB558_001422 [Smittium angustum]
MKSFKQIFKGNKDKSTKTERRRTLHTFEKSVDFKESEMQSGNVFQGLDYWNTGARSCINVNNPKKIHFTLSTQTIQCRKDEVEETKKRNFIATAFKKCKKHIMSRVSKYNIPGISTNKQPKLAKNISITALHSLNIALKVDEKENPPMYIPATLINTETVVVNESPRPESIGSHLSNSLVRNFSFEYDTFMEPIEYTRGGIPATIINDENYAILEGPRHDSVISQSSNSTHSDFSYTDDDSTGPRGNGGYGGKDCNREIQEEVVYKRVAGRISGQHLCERFSKFSVDSEPKSFGKQNNNTRKRLCQFPEIRRVEFLEHIIGEQNCFIDDNTSYQQSLVSNFYPSPDLCRFPSSDSYTSMESCTGINLFDQNNNVNINTKSFNTTSTSSGETDNYYENSVFNGIYTDAAIGFQQEITVATQQQKDTNGKCNENKYRTDTTFKKSVFSYNANYRQHNNTLQKKKTNGDIASSSSNNSSSSYVRNDNKKPKLGLFRFGKK